MGDESRRPADVTTIDRLAERLREFRVEAGSPSYAEIAQRVSRLREAAGTAPERARVARTTVYDVFRAGRRRLDVALVHDVLTALGLDAEAVEDWTARARHAVVEAPAPAPPAPPVPEAPATAGRSRRRLVGLLMACLLVNLLGRALVHLLDLPLHLDMTGTAIAAIVLGPWWGALVGLSTSTVGIAVGGLASLSFAVVNVTGALVWGYGVHRFGMGRSIKRFFGLCALAALACSVVATPVLLAYGGQVGPIGADVASSVLELTHVVVVSVFLSNLLISLADKMISGFVALAVADSGTPNPLLRSDDADRPAG